jgi:glyoxalase-like protein
MAGGPARLDEGARVIRVTALVGVAWVAAAIAMAHNRKITPSGDTLARVDHLVYATPDVNASVDDLDRRLGVRATTGGQHPGRGTRNALIALGPATYLEIIGPDPAQPNPETPRNFGIDRLKAPRLVTWAAKGTDLPKIVSDAAGHGIVLGAVRPGSRRRPDGVLLTWTFTNPLTVVADGIVPFFIDWGDTPHPATSAVNGGTLAGLRAEHPDAERARKILAQLGIDLPVTNGPAPLLVATIDTARGRVELR